MQRRTILISALAAIVLLTAAAGAWWLKDQRLQLHRDPDWPKSLRATAEAVEKVDPGPDGTISEGDRTLALERAEWKAYYYAQLRAAESLGKMKLSQETTIKDFQLADMEVRSSFADTVQAAVEVESERVVEHLDDAVRVRVAVEIPSTRLTGFRTVLLEALRTGRISLERVERSTAEGGLGEENPELGLATVRGREPDDGETPGGRIKPRPYVSHPTPTPRYTGILLRLLERDSPGPAPTIFDALGSEVGSSYNLPPERRGAGFPLAEDQDSIRRWVGDSPCSYDVTVSRGDLFLRKSLSAEEVLEFRKWLEAGKIVMTLAEKEG